MSGPVLHGALPVSRPRTRLLWLGLMALALAAVVLGWLAAGWAAGAGLAHEIRQLTASMGHDLPPPARQHAAAIAGPLVLLALLGAGIGLSAGIMCSVRLRTAARPEADHDRFAALVERMPLGVLIVAAQRIRFVNEAAAQMSGRSGERGVGGSMASWLSEPDQARVQRLLAQPAAQVTAPQVLEVWSRGGAAVPSRHWRLRAQPLRWEGSDAWLVTLGDITELTQADQRTRELAGIVEQTSDAVMLTSAEGVIRYVNPGFERLSGWRSDELLGKTPALFKSGAHDEHFYRQLWETVRAGRTFHAQVLNRRKDGATYHAIKTITPMFDAQARLVSFVNIDKDFGDQHAAQERLARLALHDPLTGLANRALLEDHVREAIARNQRVASPFALLFIDLDGFKAVNDSRGHHIGDRVLKEVARRLQAVTREMDIVARLGGDEFVLLLQDVAEPAVVDRIAAKLLHEIEAPIEVEADPAYVGGSIGIALHPRDGDNAQVLLQQADEAMYRAKREGGRRMRHAGPVVRPTAAPDDAASMA